MTEQARPRRRRTPKASEPRRRLLFALVTVLGILVLGDLALRGFLFVRGRPVGELSARYRSARQFRLKGEWQLYDSRHPYLPYVLRPNLDLTISFDNSLPTGVPGKQVPNPRGYQTIRLHLVTNSAGFRGPEVSLKKPEGGFRVLCLGDSTTQGYYEDRDTYPRQLEARLRARLPARTVEVLNGGVQGYTTAESLVNFEFRLLPYQPDVVIAHHGMNDLKAALAPGFRPDYAHWRQHLRPPEPLLLDHLPTWFDASAFFVLFRETLLQRAGASRWEETGLDTPPDFQSDPSPGRAVFLRNLRSLVAAARSAKVQPILSTFYYAPSVDTPQARKIAEYLGEQNEGVRALGRELGVPVADVARDLPADRALTFDDMHFTPEGDRLRAEIFLRTMEQEHIILPVGE